MCSLPLDRIQSLQTQMTASANFLEIIREGLGPAIDQLGAAVTKSDLQVYFSNINHAPFVVVTILLDSKFKYERQQLEELHGIFKEKLESVFRTVFCPLDEDLLLWHTNSGFTRLKPELFPTDLVGATPGGWLAVYIHTDDIQHYLKYSIETR